MKGVETDNDMDRLREDLTRVRQDLGKLWSRVLANIAGRSQTEAAPPAEAGDMAQDMTEDMTEDPKEADGVKHLVQKVNACIEANPAAALLIAFGLGLLVSRVTNRPRR